MLKKIREINYSMVNTTYKSTQALIMILQQSRRTIKSKFYKNISNYYDEMNIGNLKFEEDTFSKNVRGISKNYYEVLLLMKFLQTKPQTKNMNIKYYDLYYTVIEERNDSEIVNNKYEDNEIDYINFNDFLYS